jgi:hypothetical protein
MAKLWQNSSRETTMISHTYQCIFIHIPKCAGTSIEYALGHINNHTGRGGQDHRSLRMIEKPCPIPRAFYSKENIVEFFRRQKLQYVTKVRNPNNKNTVSRRQYISYFKFTIVRNPWDRAVSWYSNVICDTIHRKKHGITDDMSFKEFLKRFAGKGMLKSQLYWIKGFDGSIPLDYIGRFENLSNDVQEIFKRLNLKEITLPHKIKGNAENYRDYYDTEANEIIREVYKEDIEMFDYAL